MLEIDRLQFDYPWHVRYAGAWVAAMFMMLGPLAGLVRRYPEADGVLQSMVMGFVALLPVALPLALLSAWLGRRIRVLYQPILIDSQSIQGVRRVAGLDLWPANETIMLGWDEVTKVEVFAFPDNDSFKDVKLSDGMRLFAGDRKIVVYSYLTDFKELERAVRRRVPPEKWVPEVQATFVR